MFKLKTNNLLLQYIQLVPAWIIFHTVLPIKISVARNIYLELFSSFTKLQINCLIDFHLKSRISKINKLKAVIRRVFRQNHIFITASKTCTSLLTQSRVRQFAKFTCTARSRTKGTEGPEYVTTAGTGQLVFIPI